MCGVLLSKWKNRRKTGCKCSQQNFSLAWFKLVTKKKYSRCRCRQNHSGNSLVRSFFWFSFFFIERLVATKSIWRKNVGFDEVPDHMAGLNVKSDSKNMPRGTIEGPRSRQAGVASRATLHFFFSATLTFSSGVFCSKSMESPACGCVLFLFCTQNTGKLSPSLSERCRPNGAGGLYSVVKVPPPPPPPTLSYRRRGRGRLLR